MAQPIPLQLTSQAADGAGGCLHDALNEHTQAILSALELLQLLHDRGVLDLLRGLVGAGDQVVGMVTAAVDAPESVRAIRNFILLTKFFANIPTGVINSLVNAVEEGAKREKAHPAPGVLQLLRRLRGEDSRQAVAVTLDLLESVGKSLRMLR